MTVSSGWRRRPRGSRPGTGVRNVINTPRSPLLANVSPRSVTARRAGPTVFRKAYGPVTSAPRMFAMPVRTCHGPNRASSARSPISTQALLGVIPKSRATRRYAGVKSKREPLDADAHRSDSTPARQGPDGVCWLHVATRDRPCPGPQRPKEKNVSPQAGRRGRALRPSSCLGEPRTPQSRNWRNSGPRVIYPNSEAISSRRRVIVPSSRTSCLRRCSFAMNACTKALASKSLPASLRSRVDPWVLLGA